MHEFTGIIVDQLIIAYKSKNWFIARSRRSAWSSWYVFYQN